VRVKPSPVLDAQGDVCAPRILLIAVGSRGPESDASLPVGGGCSRIADGIAGARGRCSIHPWLARTHARTRRRTRTSKKAEDARGGRDEKRKKE
jgi:hypothetical protein